MNDILRKRILGFGSSTCGFNSDLPNTYKLIWVSQNHTPSSLKGG